VAERHHTPEVFAPGDRGREGLGHPRETGVIVVRGDVLEPIEADAGVFDPPTDVDRLLDPPALVDVAHQFHVRADSLANEPGLLDFASR